MSSTNVINPANWVHITDHATGITRSLGTGCIPQPTSMMGPRFTLPRYRRVSLGPVDLRPYCPVVGDQSQTRECVIYTAVDAYTTFRNIRHIHPPIDRFSHVFTNYFAHKRENTIGLDNGVMILTAFESGVNEGFCPMQAWLDGMDRTWIDPVQFEKDQRWVNPKPPFPVYTAKHHRGVTHRAINMYDENMLHAALCNGFPVAFRISFSGWFWATGSDGTIPWPPDGDIATYSHALILVGRLADGRWIVRNSWGTSWGDKGYGYLQASAFQPNPRPDGHPALSVGDGRVWHQVRG